ncbi:alpha/beta hydrolase fold protein-3 domain protein [Catenulispora acidiphila DSM 44928]|uniref:Alpha/beta hydrolase fold protein-3 domain protein n=1 Tax=Catenulispora acidiphila (strain DSM 44928 / JCM 14897 / NBRC 102108 / NRRL B-24433 / ID139908) TaxID=479433 RepID=C7Q7I3_CATAD|nr:alpha/beta hydrolase [Catenulispora acidiphila]ACU72176.1 alpha/beta hydrolase fold protein-3 domain protein [Catenulispora acidiphila DSM 44928]
MPLDPQIQAMRDRRVQAGAPQLYTLSLAEARAADLASIQAEAHDPEPVHAVSERVVAAEGRDIPVRVYRPNAEAVLPTLLYFFGGGWTLGSLDTCDGICRALANLAGVQVVAVGYRLAPEHRFPAAVEDCHEVLRHIAAHPADFGTDAAALAVGGDSAGGNLAAVAALLARDAGLRLAGQLLVYPNTDQLAADASMRDNVDPYLFNHRSVSWYRKHYLTSDEEATNPLASPLLAPDLTALPPALIITAEHDPLRDQGEAYARRLAAAGNSVQLTRYEGMVHGFFTMTGAVDAARHAVAQAAEALRGWFALEAVSSGAPGVSGAAVMRG